MAYEVRLRGAFAGAPYDDYLALCSAGRWAAFRKWAYTLPAKDYGELHGLADTGKVTGTGRLAKQLADALAVDPPADEAVNGVLIELADLCPVGAADETLEVTDGTRDE